MGIEKTRLLAHASIYWINIKHGIENAIKSACLPSFSGDAVYGQDVSSRGRRQAMKNSWCRHFTINDKHY